MDKIKTELNGLITKMKTFDEIIEVIKDYLSNQEAVIMYEKKIQDNLYMIDYMKESNVITLCLNPLKRVNSILTP